MGKQVDWDGVPDSMVFPDGAYHVKIAELGEETMKGDNPKLMYRAEFRIVEPKAFANMPKYENFVWGTDDDPNADDPETSKKSVGARRMKSMLKAAQVQFVPDMDELCAAAVGNELIIMITQKKEPETKKNRITGVEEPNQYAGQIRDNISAFHQLGAVETNGTQAPKAATRPAAPRPAAGAAPKPLAKPAAAPKPAPKAAGGGVATKTKAAETVKCTVAYDDGSVCGEVVPKSQYGAHVQAHADAGGSAEEE